MCLRGCTCACHNARLAFRFPPLHAHDVVPGITAATESNASDRSRNAVGGSSSVTSGADLGSGSGSSSGSSGGGGGGVSGGNSGSSSSSSSAGGSGGGGGGTSGNGAGSSSSSSNGGGGAAPPSSCSSSSGGGAGAGELTNASVGTGAGGPGVAGSSSSSSSSADMIVLRSGDEFANLFRPKNALCVGGTLGTAVASASSRDGSSAHADTLDLELGGQIFLSRPTLVQPPSKSMRERHGAKSSLGTHGSEQETDDAAPSSEAVGQQRRCSESTKNVESNLSLFNIVFVVDSTSISTCTYLSDVSGREQAPDRLLPRAVLQQTLTQLTDTFLSEEYRVGYVLTKSHRISSFSFGCVCVCFMLICG